MYCCEAGGRKWYERSGVNERSVDFCMYTMYIEVAMIWWVGDLMYKIGIIINNILN